MYAFAPVSSNTMCPTVLSILINKPWCTKVHDITITMHNIIRMLLISLLKWGLDNG